MLIVLCGVALASEPVSPPVDAVEAEVAPQLSQDAFDVQRLVAWARTYGYLRWFHPSDELAALDPELLACAGAERAWAAEDATALAVTLRELVSPVAPTVQIWAQGEEPPPAWAPALRLPSLATGCSSPGRSTPISRGLLSGAAAPGIFGRSGRTSTPPCG